MQVQHKHNQRESRGCRAGKTQANLRECRGYHAGTTQTNQRVYRDYHAGATQITSTRTVLVTKVQH